MRSRLMPLIARGSPANDSLDPFIKTAPSRSPQIVSMTLSAVRIARINLYGPRGAGVVAISAAQFELQAVTGVDSLTQPLR